MRPLTCPYGGVDLIDVRAAAGRWSHIELEELGRRHARDSFDLSDLQSRLASADWIDDTEFAAYGLGMEVGPPEPSSHGAWFQSPATTLSNA
ncbi:hypothetical protein SNARM312S_01806 [Streptomyces narbonensis]|nr:hypothetical protein [Streptomyces narbonensis]